MRSISELMSLKGRKALLTGGAGHIGLALSQTLVELGAIVAIADLDKDECEKRADELNEMGNGKAWALPVNLLDEQSTRQTVQAALRQQGGLDILIHCAAFVGTTNFPGWGVPFQQQSLTAWDAALRVNLSAAFILAQESHQALETSKHGSIIFVSSIYGMVGPDMSLYEGTAMTNPAGYGASKGALLQLARYLATVFAPEVRVNAITPGGVWRSQPEIFVNRYEKRTPMGRMGTEEDFKGAVAYLASDLSAYVTGQNLIVDGGWTAW
jgi:NAD(P)-dependent dehydrogenase (short-subunit alcohol dehydrogenase family)